MTWGEIDAVCEGYERRYARNQLMNRLTAAILYNANRDPKKTSGISPKDLLPLITDGPDREVKLMSKEEWQEFNKLMDSVEWQNKS